MIFIFLIEKMKNTKIKQVGNMLENIGTCRKIKENVRKYEDNVGKM